MGKSGKKKCVKDKKRNSSELEHMEMMGQSNICLLQESPLRILRAAEAGRVKEVEKLLDANIALLKVTDGKGRSAFHLAALHDQVGVLKLLAVLQESELNVEDVEGNTPLHLATEAEALDAIHCLLESGADGRKLNEKSLSPLHVAAEGGKMEALKALAKHLDGLDVDGAGPHGRTPLHLACIWDRDGCVRILLEEFQASPRRTCSHSYLAIHEAARHASAKSLDILLQSCSQLGHNVEELMNLPDVEGNVALHLAVHGGNSETVRLCLNAGAKISTTQKELSTAVHLACAQGSLDIVQLMFKSQPSEKDKCLNSRDLEQMTPLHYAAMFDHADVVKFLVSHDSMLNVTEKNKWTPLFLAATRSAWKAVMALLNLGANIQHQDFRGQTLLHILVKVDEDLQGIISDDNLEKLKCILETRDKAGNTPLHIAAQHGHTKCVAKLLQMGSSILAKNLEGDNAFHIACNHRKCGVIRQLMRQPEFSSVMVNESNGQGLTPFHIAAQQGDDKVLEILIKLGAFLHRDHQGRTPLHLAVQNGHLSSAKLILNTHSHLIDLTDQKGNTALHSAAAFNRPAITALLLHLNSKLTYNKEGYSAMDVAVASKFSKVALLMVTHPKRGNEILGLTEGKNPCIMLPLIATMPGVARAVLDKSVRRSTAEKLDSAAYKIEYDFEWLQLPASSEDASGTSKFLPILNQMVRYERVSLLSHELSRKYLDMKWNAYGKYFQFMNLFLYLIFLSLLTLVATSYYNKDRTFYIRWNWWNSPEEDDEGKNGTCSGDTNVINSYYFQYDDYNASRYRFGHTEEKWNQLVQVEACVTTCVILNLLVEAMSVYRHGLKYCQNVNTWVWLTMNWCSLLTTGYYTFALVLGTELEFLPKRLFNPGVAITTFLAWFYLLLMMERFDSVGIYVSMFGEILKTMIRVLIIFSILIVAFAVTFYIMLSSGNHTGFSDIPIAILRTFSMMLGDIDFMNTFLYPYHCYNMEKENKTNLRVYTLLNECKYPRRVDFPYAIFPVVCLYMICMPIVMINLLIGLAVGDIEAVRSNAQLKRLSMQVESHTNLEKLLPIFLLDKIESSSITMYPNVTREGFNPFKYVSHFFQPSLFKKDEEEKESESWMEESVTDRLEKLVEEMEQMKEMMQTTFPMITLLCEKMNVPVTVDSPNGMAGAGGDPKSAHRNVRPRQLFLSRGGSSMEGLTP